jgi:hypothetical protein
MEVKINLTPKGKGVAIVHKDGVIRGRLPEGMSMPDGFRYPTEEEIEKEKSRPSFKA